MDNEYRNPIVVKCIQELKEGKPFLKGMKTTVKVMLVKSSPELRQALLERASEDTLFLAKLPPEVIQILLQPTDKQSEVQPEAQPDEQSEVQPEVQPVEQSEVQPEVQPVEQSEVQPEVQPVEQPGESSTTEHSHRHSQYRRDWDPFTVHEDSEVPSFERYRFRHSRNAMKHAADSSEVETNESTDTESEDSESDTEQPTSHNSNNNNNNNESEPDETTDAEEVNILKNFVQKLTVKRVASGLGILLSLPLIRFIPLGPIALLVGIIPLVSGIFGGIIGRNAFRPMKLIWFAISLILSTQVHWLFSLAVLVDGILVLMDEKVTLNTVIPPKGTDQIIWQFTTLNRFGIPIPWQVFTVERSGDLLRVTNTTQLFGGDNSQGFLYLKDPEVKSTFAEAVFGDYQYVTMKDTSHDNEDVVIRLPRPVVTAISKSQLLRRLCEVAKSPAETTVVTHNHI